MNLYIRIKNLRPKNYDSGFKIADTPQLHEFIAEELAKDVGRLLTDIVDSLERESIIWDQDDFEITIQSNDGNRGSREKTTKHVCKQETSLFSFRESKEK